MLVVVLQDDAYSRLVLNPKIMRIVHALTAENCTLVDTALIKMDREGGAKNESVHNSSCAPPPPVACG